MPHGAGIKATVTRLDSVILLRNIFDGYDAMIYPEDGDEPETVPNVRVGIVDPWIRNKVGVDTCGGAYPNEDDVLLWCERSGEYINWYRITYGTAKQ